MQDTLDRKSFSRHLRRTMTDAERRLWRYLRNRRLKGWKFRRQHPAGPYVLDFVCLEAGLVVEADGGQHLDAASDAVRTAFLVKRGYRVLRFWNHEVLLHTRDVLEAILRALAERCPDSNPSPAEASRGSSFSRLREKVPRRGG